MYSPEKFATMKMIVKERKEEFNDRGRQKKKKDRDMEELFKIPTIMLILRSNLKYERKSLQKSHQ